MDNKTSNVHAISLIFIYFFINFLFFYKYISRISDYYLLLALGLTCLIAFVVMLLSRNYFLYTVFNARNKYFFSVAIIAILLWFAMMQFNPAEIQVGRYPALNDWLQRLLGGQFPYESEVPHTGFPFWFFIALPFYLLGDLGLLQICSFIVFTVLIHLQYKSKNPQSFQTIVLLLMSPIYLYEIVVRSDLFSNMVVVLVYLKMCEKYLKGDAKSLIVFGMLGGLCMSSRGIVLVIFVLFFGSFFKAKPFKEVLIYLCSLGLGFFLSIIPFILWDYYSFMYDGPFSRQTAYIQTWQLILVLLTAIILSWRGTVTKNVYQNIAFLLFGISFLVFGTHILNNGWDVVIFQHNFDISYFIFPLPFLLLEFPFKMVVHNSKRE